MPFIPTDIANCKLWLNNTVGLFRDAAKTLPCTANDDLVYAWADQSGQGNDAVQATSGSRPKYLTATIGSQPGVRFGTGGTKTLTTTNSFLTSAYNAAFTFFIVARHANQVTTPVVSASSGVTQFYSGRTLNGAYQLNYASAGAAPSPVLFAYDSASDAQIEVYRFNGRGKTQRANGRHGYTIASGTSLALSGTLTLGATSANGFAWSGDECEIIIYNAVLTDTQIQQVENYLAAKYTSLTLLNLSMVLCDGNSLTAGTGASSPSTESYPAQLIGLLGVSNYCFVNIGVSGQTSTQMTSDGVAEIDYQYSSLRPANILCAWEITNELISSVSAGVAIDNFKAYCLARKTAGFKVIALTVLPRQTGTFETSRQTCNTEIRNPANIGVYWDAVADIAADTRLGDAGDNLNTTYYPDGVHLNAVGYGIVAALIASIIPTLLVAPGIPTGLAGTAGNIPIATSWNLVTGAANYKLRRNGTLIYTGTNPFYNDSVANGANPAYTIQATNLSGDSAESGAVAVTLGGGGSGTSSVQLRRNR